ncbi:glucose-6-phosphate isomerase [Fructobacillus tropaeoli]|uniref:Glucose-6-phosphate isomerase n=1 Tax=Fructobacillus tropaeoli TaxID=709323 RepID=A0A3F3HDC9_9LACO|nr:glucose-6-phosphate isomerase [Fructobacillus tropaeoli]GAP04910.1 glucose-6-phosphate isomerase [Fructobacillus tropaeoli]
MAAIHFDSNGLQNFVADNELDEIKDQVRFAHQTLVNKTGAGADFTDWFHWASIQDQASLAPIHQAADAIKKNSKVLVVIGIGGSYLGSRMAIDFLRSPWHNELVQGDEVKVYFAGNAMSPMALDELDRVIGDQDFSVNVISKSGTTTEPAVAFRFLKQRLVAKYGEEGAKERIVATTDAKKGALKNEATAEGYQTLVIPDGIGGRFSVLSAVGLLPMAVAGINIENVLAGAAEAEKTYSSDDVHENPALAYAAYRRILYDKGYTTEILANWEPSLQYLSEWWKQLMGESEGKNQKGIYPSSANYSTDLHSLGQYIQEGRRDLFETVVRIDHSKHDLPIPKTGDNEDGLLYLEGKSLEEVNKTAATGVVLAHVDGGVPNLAVHLDRQDEAGLGELIYFFELAVGVSGYLFNINPFNQPGVEAYKTAMFALLDKPGYEEQSKVYHDRLK